MADKKVAGLQTPATTGVSPKGGYAPAIATAGAVKKTRVPSFSTSYQAPDFGTTQAITNAVYQNLMGRDATNAEIAQYHQQYVQYAQTHPTSSSSSMDVVDPSTGQAVSHQGTSTSHSLSEQDFISNLVNGKAEAKDYTAATTYMDAIQREISQARGVY